MRPCRAICPGPPSNSCSTVLNAEVASAHGPIAAPSGWRTRSATKNYPAGVGVAGRPTITGKRLMTLRALG